MRLGRLGGAAAVALMAGTAVGQPFGGFAPQQSFGVGNGPRRLVLADFNGDGRPDLAAPKAAGDGVWVGLGVAVGDGLFGPVNTFSSMGLLPLTIRAADVDSDGDVDLTVINGNDPSISVFKGTGTGTFTAHQNLWFDPDEPPFPGAFIAHATADFTGDGHVDAVIQSLTTNALMLVPNNGTGTFGAFQVIEEDNTFAFPSDVAAADFDSDGDPDLAVIVGSSSVRVYLNNGNGTFSSPSIVPMAGDRLMQPLADVNGDGHIDLVASRTINPGGFISVSLGAGNGTFGAVTTYPANRPTSMTSADFDGDGDRDLAFSSFSPFNTVSVMLGDGSGGFGPAQAFASGGSDPDGLAAADLNGDGYPDLVVVNRVGASASAFLNLTTPPPCPADFNNSGSVTVQDIFDFLEAYFTGDPRADINGEGGVTVQDIFDYLAAYFAAC